MWFIGQLDIYGNMKRKHLFEQTDSAGLKYRISITQSDVKYDTWGPQQHNVTEIRQ